jgi:glycosyltransferase involved in cell wall biosynthesis
VNIVFLDQYSALGGAQQCLLDLLPAIEERGWSARAAVPPGGPLGGILRERGLGVDEIRSGPYRCGKKTARDVLRFAADVPAQTVAIAEMLDAPTDLLYVNGPRMLIAAALAAAGRTPILFHAHHSIAQRSAACLEGLALRQSGAMVAACCDVVAEPLRKWVPNERIHTIPNGTSGFGFRQRRFVPGNVVRVGVVGRIAPEKGQLEFLLAAALLMPHAPLARFVICGAPLFGDHDYYRNVLRIGSGLPVEFLDWQKDVGAVMHDLDILVIPSKQEGMPRVLIEAFSAGLPVVAFPAGGIPEVIEDKITGFLARGGSTGDLAQKLREVLEADPQGLRAVAQNARRQWELRYTLAAYRERITNLMEQCAGHGIPAILSS